MKRKNSMKMVASRKKKKDKKSKRKAKPKSETRKSKEEKTKRLKNSHLLVRCVLFEFIFALLFLLCGIGEFFLKEIVLAIALFMFAVIFIILGVELWTAFWFRVPCLLLFHTLLCAVLILSILILSTLLTLVYDTELLGREELGNSILGILFVSLFACGLFVLFGVAAYLLYNELEPLETVVVRPKNSGMKGQPLGSSEGSLSNAMNRSQNDNVANQKWCGPFISVTESTQSLSPVKPPKKPKVKKMKMVEKPIKSPSLTTSQTIQSSVAKTQSLSLQTANTKEDTEKETKQKPPAIAIKAISETNVEPASRAKSKSSYIQELDEVNALIESTLSKTKDQTRTQSELGSHSSQDDKMEMPRAYSMKQFSSSDCNHEPPSYTELFEREMKRYTTPRETSLKLRKRHEPKTTSRRRLGNTEVKQEMSRNYSQTLNSSSILYSSVRDRSETLRSLFLADRPIVIEVKDETTRTETIVTEESTEDLPYYISSKAVSWSHRETTGNRSTWKLQRYRAPFVLSLWNDSQWFPFATRIRPQDIVRGEYCRRFFNDSTSIALNYFEISSKI